MLALIMSLFIVTVTGCGPVYKTTFNYTPPKSDTGKMCAAQCIQARTTCQTMCEMQKQNCITQAKIDADRDYEAYKTEQLSQSKPVKKIPADFDKTWQCDSACGCGNTFNMCYQTCGGIVTPHKECVAFCDKK
jgi:hypothetical protein